MIASRKESYDKPRQYIEKQRHHFASKGPYSQDYGLSSSHVQMWELDHKEGWVLKNWCFEIVLDKTLESPLDCKEIKPVNPKGNQPWIVTGRTDAEAPIHWPPDMKSWLIGKDPEPWCWERLKAGEQGAEDETIGWHHWLNGHWASSMSELESEQAAGNSEGQGSLACCSPWGPKESKTTQWLNNKRQL